MKKLTAIMLSALMLTTFVPLQGHAENITENIEVIEENGSTILRAGNLEYAVNEAGYAVPVNVVDKSVTSIYLPAEVNGYPVSYYPNISEEVISACSKLTEVKADTDSAWLKDVDGVLFDKSGQSLLAYPPAKEGDYVIPDGTETVWQMSFWNTTRLGSVTVPESVVEINAAFRSSSITEFIGEVPLTSALSLQNCFALKSITISPNYTGKMTSGWFCNLPSLEYLAFTPEVVVNGDIALIDCPKLRCVELPQSRPEMDYPKQNSFVISNCSSLESVSLYNGLLGSYQVVGRITVNNCPALRDITIKQIPYVYSRHKLELQDLPALEHITYLELPQSVIAGTKPENDGCKTPLVIHENCGHFAVSGHLANTNLRRWCEENGIPFESLDKRGDANLDGEVSVVDAVMLQRWLLGAAGVSCGENIDLNADGSVDIFDLALLKRMIMER